MGGGDTRIREPESQLALAEQAAINLRRYADVFVPLENQFMETTMATFDQPNYDRAMGMAGTQTAGVYERGLEDFKAAANQRGIDPSSGAYTTQSNALRAAMSRGMGTSMADMGMSNTDQGLAGLTAIVRQGQGLQNDAMQGQMELASNQLDRVTSRAQDAFRRNSSIGGAFGTAAGMGASYVLPGVGGIYG